MTFLAYPLVCLLSRPVMLLDAIGLALFAVTGAQKALAYDIDPIMAAVLGMIVGHRRRHGARRAGRRGALRAGTDLYAVAALAAGAIVCWGM